MYKRIVEWKGTEKIKQEKEKKKIAWICVAIAVVMLGGAFLFAKPLIVERISETHVFAAQIATYCPSVTRQ